MRIRVTLAAILALSLLSATAHAAPKANPARIISLKQLGGAMKQHRGRVLVLHFWASWCAPCLHELPLMEQLAREARRRGIDIYSVSLDDPSARGATAVERTLAERRAEGLTRVILRIDNPDAVIGRVDPAWAGTIPAFFVYDRKGKLHRSHVVGEMTPGRFDELVGGLLPKPVK